MSVTIHDAASAAALAQAAGQVQVFGPDGQVLGRFTPAPRPGLMFPELGMTDAELEALDNDPNPEWVPAAEVEARLRDLRDR